MKVAFLAAMLIASSGSSDQPSCGVWQYPIGHGVRLNMPMGDGQRNFSLDFLIENKGEGELRLRKPFGLTIWAIDSEESRTNLAIPWVYLTELYPTDHSGNRVYISSVTLTCGETAILSQSASRKLQTNALDEQGRGLVVSFPKTAVQRACVQGFEAGNRLTLKLVTNEKTPRTLNVNASLPVGEMIAAARKLYAQRMAASRVGECWIATYPAVP